MRPTAKTRKPIDALTEVDITTFPVWEFCADEEDVEGSDETWVRPVETTVLEFGLYSLSVATDYTCANGRKLIGIVGVTTADDVTIAPAGAVLFEGNYLYVANATEPFSAEARARLAKALGADASEVFPLCYRLRVPVEGETELRTGQID